MSTFFLETLFIPFIILIIASVLEIRMKAVLKNLELKAVISLISNQTQTVFFTVIVSSFISLFSISWINSNILSLAISLLLSLTFLGYLYQNKTFTFFFDDKLTVAVISFYAIEKTEIGLDKIKAVVVTEADMVTKLFSSKISKTRFFVNFVNEKSLEIDLSNYKREDLKLYFKEKQIPIYHKIDYERTAKKITD